MFRVADGNAVTPAHQIAYHIVLTGKNFLVQYLCHHFRVVLRLDAQANPVAGNGVLAYGDGATHKALPSGLTL